MLYKVTVTIMAEVEIDEDENKEDAAWFHIHNNLSDPSNPPEETKFKFKKLKDQEGEEE